MPIRPTFFGFEMARSALSASQRNIDVTGQNIANINTDGYSRQRVNLSAVGAGGLEWKYPITPADNVGLGVNIDSIKRVRDEFLDIRYRTENGHSNRFEVKGEILTQVENLVDEFVIDNVYAILTDFMNALQNFHRDADEVEFASMMRSAGLKLTTALNKISSDISDVVSMQIEQMEVVKNHVNTISASLDAVNKEIRTQYLINPLSVSNELLDKRDLLLDQLSAYGQVTVVHDYVTIDIDDREVEVPSGGIWVYFGEMNLTDIDPKGGDFGHDNLLVVGNKLGHKLIDFNKENYYDEALMRYNLDELGPVRFTWGEAFGEAVEYDSEGEPIITKSGQIFGYYEMMNGLGDILASDDEVDSATKGIPYFMSILNNFTATFVDIFNGLNEDNDLFTSADGNDISAFNIRIAEEWQDDAMYIVRTLLPEDAPGDSRNDNILKMIDALRREDTEFTYGAGDIFKGSFQQFIGMLNTEIALELDFNNKMQSMSDILVLNIDNMRESIKGVSEDEEAMNLAKFQKSYNAAARYMTVLDEMLELIVLRLGIVGR